MELRPDPPQPGSAERIARSAVVVFLVLASALLVFALGFGLREITTDNKTTTTTAAAPRAAASNAVTSKGGSVGAAVIDEIVNVLKDQYVDRKALDADALKDAAISGIIQSLNDRETNYISPDDLKAGALQLSSTYQGIGASVSGRSGAIQIVAPFRDSPAEARSAIQEFDTIPSPLFDQFHSTDWGLL